MEWLCLSYYSICHHPDKVKVIKSDSESKINILNKKYIKNLIEISPFKKSIWKSKLSVISFLSSSQTCANKCANMFLEW